MTIRAAKLSRVLSSRYGLDELHCEEWSEIELWGGIGMDGPTFTALADAAKAQGDVSATVYELESIEVEFPPIDVSLDFESFNRLKASAASLFDVAVVPRSKAWAALLTNELETFVYGPPAFLAAVSQNLAADRLG